MRCDHSGNEFCCAATMALNLMNISRGRFHGSNYTNEINNLATDLGILAGTFRIVGNEAGEFPGRCRLSVKTNWRKTGGDPDQSPGGKDARCLAVKQVSRHLGHISLYASPEC